MLQGVMEKPLEKKAGRNFGPPGSKKLIYFIDDMNMPQVEFKTLFFNFALSLAQRADNFWLVELNSFFRLIRTVRYSLTHWSDNIWIILIGTIVQNYLWKRFTIANISLQWILQQGHSQSIHVSSDSLQCLLFHSLEWMHLNQSTSRSSLHILNSTNSQERFKIDVCSLAPSRLSVNHKATSFWNRYKQMLWNTLIRLSKLLSKFTQGSLKSFYQLLSNSITFSIFVIFQTSSRECYSPSQRILRHQWKWQDFICMKLNAFMVTSSLNLRLVSKLILQYESYYMTKLFDESWFSRNWPHRKSNNLKIN